MKKYLEEYIEVINKLPIKNKYTKEDLLIKDLLIDKENNIEIYYAPHNEYINVNAKVFIIGITPGFEQMRTSILTAKQCIEKGMKIDDIKYECKRAGRFSGSLRKNIISMLDTIKLNQALRIDSSCELFEDKDYLLHTTSLIPYSVFVKGKNYTGHTPKLIKSEFLMKYVYENFIEDLNKLDNVLIIPLGKAVEEVLDKLVEQSLIKKENILKGFPHPSGANGHRLAQLEENKENMINIIKSKF